MSAPTLRLHTRLVRRGTPLVALVVIAVACTSTTKVAPCETFAGGYIVVDGCSGERGACALTQDGCTGLLTCTGQPEVVLDLSGNTLELTAEGHGRCTGTLAGDVVQTDCEDGCEVRGDRVLDE